MPDYRDYAPWLEARYGQRVYKVPLNIPGGTCPNRDGTVGTGGCIFCESSGFWISVFAGQYDVFENNGLRIKHFMNAVFMHTNLSVICRPIPIRICRWSSFRRSCWLPLMILTL